MELWEHKTMLSQSHWQTLIFQNDKLDFYFRNNNAMEWVSEWWNLLKSRIISTTNADIVNEYKVLRDYHGLLLPYL